MALTKDINHEGLGLVVAGAYITVVRPTISTDKLRVGFNLQVRISADSDEPLTDEHSSAPYDLEGSNLFIQAYEHLKTLERFSGCADC